MKKSKLLAIGLIGLLLAGGLILAGCESEGCKGSGECTVTIGQGSYGLYVDYDAPMSSCGKVTQGDTTGCKPADMIGGPSNRTVNRPAYGTHSCDC